MDRTDPGGRKVYRTGYIGTSDFTVNSNFLITAAFAACMVIFVFPLFLLGTVTPSLAKYSVDSLEDVKVTTYDGRAYLQAEDKKYDVIMVDAYQDITIPFQMSSVEFFTMVKEHLSDNGVMVVNMNMRGSGEGTINQYLADTISSVFGNVSTVDVQGSTNRELFASDDPQMLATLKENANQLENKDLQNLMYTVADNSQTYEAGSYIMTDDKAPVELLGMRVIDQIIQEEVAYYRQIYEQDGFQGLLEQL